MLSDYTILPISEVQEDVIELPVESQLVTLLSAILNDNTHKRQHETEISNNIPAHIGRQAKQLQHTRPGNANP